MQENNEGLRERKRRDTRERIVDAAMRLVHERGFDAVTVENICAAADISRRTFFNYMDSKDEAILGPLPYQISDKTIETIATTPSDNLLDLIFTHIEIRPDVLSRTQLARRREILADNPSLAGAAYVRKAELLSRLTQAVASHFEAFPQDRKLENAPVSIEVNAIVNLFYVAVATYLSNPDFPASEPPGPAALRLAARFHTDLAKEMTW
ncbi:TetR/AcrR family transcriptional regulator [Corynebacterium mayonis]|uniref:TetR/AcrR family transcriptional regulator n=1 Tax=Corynebacterium mayonis TaxID=3062461 RepID=UPI0031406FFB